MSAENLGHPEDQKLIEYYERQIKMLKSRPARNIPALAKQQLGEIPEHWHRRQRVWKHNSFLGHSVMMRQHLTTIRDADSTTAKTKHLASTILGLVTQLQNSLQERVDP